MNSLAHTIKLGAPLAGAQMVTFLLTFIDALAVGYFGEDAIAGLALASSFLITVQLLGNGTISIVGIQNARYRATGKQGEAFGLHVAGLIFALIYFAVSLATVIAYIVFVLNFTDTTSSSRAFITSYLAVASFAIPFSMAFIMLRSVLASMELTRSTLSVSIAALACKTVVNVLAVVFISTPTAGAIAMGVGLVASNVVLCGGLSMSYLIATKGDRPGSFRGQGKYVQQVKSIVIEGLPIGVTYAFEAAIYAVIAWLMGLISQVALTAHYAAKQYVHLTFMSLNGIAQITSLKVSGLWSAGKTSESTSVGIESTLFAVAVSLMLGVVYWLCSESLTRLIVPSEDITPALLTMAQGVFLAAILMQLFDNIANIFAGVLRGIGKSSLAMVSTAVGYYIVGLPSAYVFSFRLSLGAPGAWLGLSVGLAATCILMAGFYKVELNNESTCAKRMR